MDTHHSPQMCSCPHHHHDDHESGPDGPHQAMNFFSRWVLSLLLVTSVFVFLEPFLISQLFIRVVSYSSYGHYPDVVRICKKILIFDRHNRRASTALGFAYMDQGRLDEAIEAFEKFGSLDFQEWEALYFEWGRAYFLKKEYTKAVGYFELVRKIGPQAGILLDAAMLKYRHGTLGFQSVHSLRNLLAMLAECYKQMGDMAKARQIQTEYEAYNKKHKTIIF